MSALLVRAQPDDDGPLVRVTPESAGWRHVGFEAYRLAAGASIARATEGREVCVVVLSGRADIACAGREWAEVGERASVFSGEPPWAVYLPPGGVVEVTGAGGEAEVALCWAPARVGGPPMALPAGECRVSTRGEGATERRIHDILMENRRAESLLVTEVLTPAGHWSSYPPHKHDTDDDPREAYLEETYYHRLRTADRFALQRVYTDDRSLDEALAVRDGDVVLVPRGYHPVSASPGSDLYSLNVMAGPRRRWQVTVDPSFR